MVYVSIDIETSGLDSEKNSILSFGAIIEDTQKKLPFDECPKFNAIILQREIVGSPRAITMNKKIIEMIGDFLEADDEMRHNLNTHSDYLFLEKHDLVKHFYWFLDENGFGNGLINNSGGYTEIHGGKHRTMINTATKPIRINVAGKNFATFDKLFLEKLEWWKKLIQVRQRILDPGILYTNWNQDETIPSLYNCKQRANISGEVTHNALDDAWDVIQLLRKFY